MSTTPIFIRFMRPPLAIECMIRGVRFIVLISLIAAAPCGAQDLPDPGRRLSKEEQNADPEAWVFPSAKRTRPLDRDSAWRWLIRPRLKAVGLELATFQIMRRTHASLSRQVGIDPKLVADQLGHGLGVHLDVYTVAALEKRQHAVEVLEASLVHPEKPSLNSQDGLASEVQTA